MTEAGNDTGLGNDKRQATTNTRVLPHWTTLRVRMTAFERGLSLRMKAFAQDDSVRCVQGQRSSGDNGAYGVRGGGDGRIGERRVRRRAGAHEEDAAAAADRGDVLYGGGWAVWPGRHYRHGGVLESAAAVGGDPGGVEFADKFDGGGAGFGAAGGGRVLLLGEAGAGRVLGVSGGVAESGGERLRYGDLSGDFCVVPGAD
jgi:hypothetical protein